MKKLKNKLATLVIAGVLICNLPVLALAAENDDPIFDLEQVVVTATKTAKMVKDVPASISVITAKDLEEANVKTLDEALQHVPGVYINNQTGMKASKISIRGLSQNRVLVLLDGMPMNQGYTGSPLRDLPLSNIDRIEVIKGPFSALYGSNAMGGVINVITKEGVKEQTVIKTAVGGEGTNRYSFSHNNSVGKLEYYLDYYKMDTDGYVEPTTPQNGKFGKNNEKYNTKLVYHFDDKDKLTVVSGKTENEYGYELNPNKGARTAKENNLQYTHKFDENRELKVQVGEFKVDPYWTLQGTSYSANPIESRTRELNYNWRINNQHLLTVGASTKLDQYDGYTLVTTTEKYKDKSGAKAKTDSLYLQDEIKMGEKTTAYLGGRYDKWKFYDGYNLDGSLPERTESSFSPKLSLVYQQNEKTTLHFSAGKSFSAPSFINTARLWPMGGSSAGYYLIPSPNIAPEKATSYEVGLERVISAKTLFSANLFQNEIEDMIMQSSYRDDGTIDAHNLYWRNVAKVRIKGAELELKHKFSPNLTSYINYTYNHSEILKHENKNNEGNQVPTVPKEMLNLGLTYAQGKIMTNLQGRYVSKVYDDDANTTYYQPHFVVDSKISYHANSDTEVALYVDNLFDKQYREDSLAPGRLVSVEVTQKF